MSKTEREFMEGACPRCHGDGQIRLVNPRWLRETRERAGLTLREMARRLDFSAAYVCDIEHGRRACSTAIHDVYRSLKAVPYAH